MKSEAGGQITATITLNPSLDITITVDGFVVDETNRWKNSRLYAGGKGIDVSRAVREMGGRTVAYGFIGGSPGRQVEILLDKEGVPVSFTPIEHETRVNFIITDTKTNQQTRIDAPGPRISKEEFERFRRKILQIYPKPSLVVMSGSVPPGLPVSIYYDMMMDVRGFNVRCLLDSDGQWLEEGIKARPYLVKPNVREAETLLKKELPAEKDIIEAAFNIIEMGVEVVAISRGKDGIIVASKQKVVKGVPPEVKVRSAVGAGDCAVAGLALKLIRNEPLMEACRLAVAMGAACVLTPGNELCHRADVERLLPQVKVWEMPARPRAKVSFPASKG
jgi:6-phosphofructokinase 2